MLIKGSVNFRALNFQYFNPNFGHLKNVNYKLSFFPFILYFSSLTKAKAEVYNISSSSSSLSLSEVMSAQFCSVLNFFASSVEINLFKLSPPTVS